MANSTLPVAMGKTVKPAGFEPLILRKASTMIPVAVGSQVTATVLKHSVDGNFIKLLVQGKTLLAQSNQLFTMGQTLMLEVAKAGKTPTLRVLSVTSKHDAVQQTLMEALPKQIKLAALYNDLFFTPYTNKKKSAPHPALPRQLNAQMPIQPTAAANPKTLPAPLKSLPATLHPLFMTLLNRPNIKTAEGLKQTIYDSGLFLEAKLLADTDMEFTGDLKANLLKLKFALKGLTGDAAQLEALAIHEKLQGLKKNIEGAIARIVLNQIASSPSDDTSKQQWHIEIPVFQGETTTSAKLLITRDSKSGNSGDKEQWSIDLELEPKGLGRLSSRIVYCDEEISTFFQCEHSTTNQLINNQLETLHQRFVGAGLKPGNISTQHNDNQPAEALSRFKFKGIVDEKA